MRVNDFWADGSYKREQTLYNPETHIKLRCYIALKTDIANFDVANFITKYYCGDTILSLTKNKAIIESPSKASFYKFCKKYPGIIKILSKDKIGEKNEKKISTKNKSS